MARKGLTYIIKRIRQILVLTIVSAIFIGLSIISLTQAETGKSPHTKNEGQTTSPTQVMQILMAPAGSSIDGCLLPIEIPETEKCNSFFSVDDEEILKNLLQNYTKCMEDQSSYYLDFTNQPTVLLTKTIQIFGRTERPLTIKGLKLRPDKSFPKGSPAIAVFGKPVKLKNLDLEGFDTGILFASGNTGRHKLVGGNINTTGPSDQAILACHVSPKVDGTHISGYVNRISIIAESSPPDQGDRLE